MLAPPPPSASHLLRVEHAVAEALLEGDSVEAAFARLLAAVGEGLGWPCGGAWLPVGGGALHCVAAWSADGVVPERFAPTVARSPQPRPLWDGTTFAIPLAGRRGMIEFVAGAPASPSEDLLATLASVGRLAGQFVGHRRAEDAVRESEARKRAMLDAALDAVITIDARGRIVEVNAAVQDVFGHPPDALIGRELASALVPGALRERHRDGLARGSGKLIGRRVEVTALHADGRELPVELTITRIDVPGPPMYTGYVRDITDRLRRERELRESRARIVAAADEARRRIERDLHDGAQSRLLAVGLDLQLIAGEIEGAAAERLAGVREELRLATVELRELARGIHPAVLTELGLVAALRTLVRRAPLPVGLEYAAETRCPAPVEAAAYFLAAEALTNVVRHAGARRADVRVRFGERLTIEIADDGRGGAVAGSGLRGMADRLAALDGSLSVLSPAGGGTVVRGVIPCGS